MRLCLFIEYGGMLQCVSHTSWDKPIRDTLLVGQRALRY